jgi:RNA polymerase sigma-70 factor, ECF subfamily
MDKSCSCDIREIRAIRSRRAVVHAHRDENARARAGLHERWWKKPRRSEEAGLPARLRERRMIPRMEWVTTSVLLDQLRAGADAAWGPFLDRFRKPVVAFGLKMGLPAQAAEDAAQETMLAFLEGLRKGAYDRTKGRLSSWLFGIASMKARQAWDARERLARDHAGERSSQPGLSQVPDAATLEKSWDVSWAKSIFTQCLERIRTEVEPDTFRAFEMVAIEQIPAAQVAEELGMTRNAVFVAKHRVLKRLRALKEAFEALV